MTVSDQAADPRSARPGIEPPAPGGFFGDPDLLERRPVVGRPFRAQQPAAVALLEAEVHLEPAEVRASAVRPARLVPMDTKPRCQVRRAMRPATGLRGP